MAYLVFARKYRPMSFEDIVAQEHVTRTLQNAIKNDRVGSGYLFCGPRGTGKTTTARVLAKAMNCVNGPTPIPCGKCDPCLEITAGSSLDVLEIDAASNTGVDDVRTLRENVRYLPAGGKKRIYVIDEVHRLSAAAFDALLKTLEEPPPHVMFIFATTEPLKVPDTILSRTQRFDFKRVGTDDLCANLSQICEKEKLQIDQPSLRLIARKADGSVRDSLSLLDQIAAYGGDEINQETVVAALGLVESRALFDFTEAIASRNSKAALETIRLIFEAGVDISDFVRELMEHLRMLLIIATDPALIPTLGLATDEAENYIKQAGRFSMGDLVRLMKIGSDLNYELKSGLDERLVLEVAAIKMSQLQATVNFEDVLKQLGTGQAATEDLFNNIEKKKTDDRLNIPSDPPPGATSPAFTPTPPPAAGFQTMILSEKQLRDGWRSFLGGLKQKREMLSSLLGTGEIKNINNNTIGIVFDSSGATNCQILEKPENLDIVKQCLSEHYKANLSIEFTADSSIPAKTNPSKNGTMSKEELNKIVASSPRLQSLVKRVNGEVIGVRKVK